MPDGSTGRYEVAVHRDVRIPTGDLGITLSGDLFLPVGAGPRPLLLTLLPYRRDGVGGLLSWVNRMWFASRGYPTLLVDLRGTGSSDGEPRAPFDPAEADDALDAIAWAVRKPWCDGSAGMWGISYGAVTAMRTASLKPPALKAIIPMMGLIDPQLDFVHPSGIRGALAPIGEWALATWLDQLLPPLDDYADPAERVRWRRRMDAEPWLMHLHRSGPDDSTWPARRIDAAAIETPALCFTGWRDLFADGMVRVYEQISGPKRLIAGPWGHTPPHESTSSPIDFLNMALSWWDRWLLGTPSDAVDEPNVYVYVQGPNPRWLALVDWPGADTRVDNLTTWKVTAPRPPDPSVGALSGMWALATRVSEPLDQHDDDLRSFCYTSPPLDQALLISGRPSVCRRT